MQYALRHWAGLCSRAHEPMLEETDPTVVLNCLESDPAVWPSCHGQIQVSE